MGEPLTPWRILSSSKVIDTPWFRVRSDRCETARGVIDAFYVVDAATWVCVVAITKDGEFVLVRQYRHGQGAITLELPAGEANAGEDAIAAARRELREETGYDGGEARLVCSVSPNPARYANLLHVVLIEGVSHAGDGENDEFEETEPVLWPEAKARELFLDPVFSNSSHAGALASVLISTGKL